MILPDVNLLVHAYNSDSSRHLAARSWLEGILGSNEPVGLAWAVILGFVRIVTQPRIVARPLPVAEAIGHVRSWIAQPTATIAHPGDRHAELLFGFLTQIGAAGNLTTDAHLAALAVEHQGELHTTDADFARFPGLRWRNPLADKRKRRG